MQNEIQGNEMARTSQMVILISYTLFSVILIGESILLSWEKWAIILVVFALIGSWVVHIRQTMDPMTRLWIYSFLMMGDFFFYGTHLTSTFDLAVVMLIVIMIYTMTGKASLITLSQVTFFVTFSYELINMYMSHEAFDALVITRSMLHMLMIIMGGWIGKTVINTWEKVQGRSSAEIQELKEATERLDNFLANVSHEIRTPTNAVMGLSAVLQKEKLPAHVTESISAISRAGHRVSEQIGDILDFTEIDMNRLSVNNENYLVGSLVNDLLVQLSSAEEGNLDFVVDLEAGVPSELVGDASKIKKILWHLINNAFKYSKEGGVYVHISPIWRSYGVNLLLEVRDTGIGMSDDEIEHVYEQFYQSDSGRSRTVGGLGLGIPIVNGFVKAMGGVMAIDSDLGEGTSVRVSIPQVVTDRSPCFSIRDKQNCVVAGFLGFMTTGHPKVREYYMEMIGNLVDSLDVPFHRVQSCGDLISLVDSIKITHLFVGTGEYIENRRYIDSLVGRMNVAVVKDRDYDGGVSKGISLLPKPFYGVQVANFLNQALRENAEDLSEEKISFPGVRALVVDDEPMNLLVARGILEGYGMAVETVLSGIEAIRACETDDFDIIFMDHMMPEMDGVEAMKRIRVNASRSKKEICIVALTANAISSAKEMFISEGFDGFIPKPIEITEFERVLRRVLPKSMMVYVVDDQHADTSADAAKMNTDISEKTAKEQNDGNEGEEKYDRIRSLCVSVETGLKYCNNDEQFYDEVLAEYARDRQNKAAALEDYYLNKNWKDYSIKVHAIKSTSKMIGAMELSQMAKELEDASKQGDEEKVREKHPLFMPKYKELLEEIAHLTGQQNDLTGGSDIADADGGQILEFAPDENNDEVLEFDPESDSDEIPEFGINEDSAG